MNKKCFKKHKYMTISSTCSSMSCNIPDSFTSQKMERFLHPSQVFTLLRKSHWIHFHKSIHHYDFLTSNPSKEKLSASTVAEPQPDNCFLIGWFFTQISIQLTYMDESSNISKIIFLSTFKVHSTIKINLYLFCAICLEGPS